jgi:hypothetical protein
MLIPAAHHEPRQGAEKLLRPQAGLRAHAHQPPRLDEPQVLGEEGPHLGEGGDEGACPVVVLLLSGGGGVGRHDRASDVVGSTRGSVCVRKK